jgi:ATP-dependent RNA helicase RhlE
MKFDQLNLIEPILRALQEEGYVQPTPIQEQAIPLVLGRNDLLGCAQTGTGKTAAFSIPVLQLLHSRVQKPQPARPIRCLILTPTRELAIQIEESLKAYGRHLPLRHAVIFGGVPQRAQTDSLKRGIDILVATPGRLLDLMQQGFVHLQSLEIFILDEADRMLDMGFVHDVRRILTKIPAKRQSLFFSATMPPEIQKLADTILVNPSKVEVAPVSSTADTIDQTIYFVEKNDKKHLLVKLLKDPKIKSALVFTRTKHGADKVVKDLLKAGYTAEAIHGNKAQNARQRALNNFKAGTTRVLIATDIAARGIDVDSLSHVINYEIPNVPETYVHRIGRTGRAGMSGIAFSFCDDEEMAYLRDIQRLIKKQIPVETDHAWSIKGAEVPLVSGHIHNNSRPAAPKKKAKPQQQRNQPPQGQSQSSSSRSSSGESANSPKPKGKGRPWHKKGPRKPNPISY